MSSRALLTILHGVRTDAYFNEHVHTQEEVAVLAGKSATSEAVEQELHLELNIAVQAASDARRVLQPTCTAYALMGLVCPVSFGVIHQNECD